MSFLPYAVSALLLALSAFFSGVGLGFMTLGVSDLKRKMELGNKAAARVYPIRKNGNLLLCTILLGNVLVNSILAVFLGSLISGVFAVIISTFLIVIIGEIVPQATFARHALKLGGHLAPFVTFFIVLFYPITKPISWMLDKALGGELPTIYSKKEIHLLIKEHQLHQKHDIGQEELRIMEAGLIFSEKPVRDVMIPSKQAFTLKHDAVLNKRLLRTIRDVGYSRIPVVGEEHGSIVGILYTKDLISFNVMAGATVGQVMRPDVVWLAETDRLGKALTLARSSCIHLIMVHSATGTFVGVVALEDILEEIIGEIDDEYDDE